MLSSDTLTLPVDVGQMVVVLRHMGSYVCCFGNSRIIVHMAGPIYSPSSSIGELYSSMSLIFLIFLIDAKAHVLQFLVA